MHEHTCAHTLCYLECHCYCLLWIKQMRINMNHPNTLVNAIKHVKEILVFCFHNASFLFSRIFFQLLTVSMDIMSVQFFAIFWYYHCLSQFLTPIISEYVSHTIWTLYVQHIRGPHFNILRKKTHRKFLS